MSERMRPDYERGNDGALLLPLLKLIEIGTRNEKLFPYEIIGGEEHLIKLKEEMGVGKNAIIAINHFSTRDAFIGLQILLRFLYPHRAIMPIARHNYKKWMGTAFGAFGVEMLPIPTAKTFDGLSRDEQRAEIKKMNKEHKKYLTATHHVLSQDEKKQGEFLAIAPQSTRESSLGIEPKVFPFEEILNSKKNKVQPIDTEKVLVLPIGIGMAGASTEDYSKDGASGYSKGEKFTVKAGEIMTLANAIEEAKSMAYPSVDYVIHNNLRKVSPPEYVVGA